LKHPAAACGILINMRCPIVFLLLIENTDLVVDADGFFPGDAREK